jgi:hypothetical protein
MTYPSPPLEIASYETNPGQAVSIAQPLEFAMQNPSIDPSRHPRLLATALLWLFGGSLLLATTLVPARTDLLGWTPFFWLFVAPLAVALTLEPRLPRQLLSLRKQRRRSTSQLIWN